MEQWVVKEPWLDVHCALGEGPFYEKETNRIRFVDIKKNQLHSASMTGGLSSLETTQLDTRVTVTSDIEGVDPRDRILLGIKYGMAILDRKTGTYEVLKNFQEPTNQRLRSNDGGCDPNGRFWLGTMTDFEHGECKPEGAIHLFGPSKVDEVFSDLTIPNAFGWSPDQRTMYFTHTTSQQVFALDYDPSTGAYSNRRVFYQHEGQGSPDGFRVDVEGNIWHAMYGGYKVLKLNPKGELVGEVLLPTRNITCVQFVGSELVITTAADDQGDARSQELGGAVFRVDVGTTGLELFKYKMQ